MVSSMIAVSELMTRAVVKVTPDESLKKVVELMAKSSISCVVVVKGKSPVGLITERDILKKVVLKNKSIARTKTRAIMTSPIVTVKPETEFHQAGELMKKKHIRHLAVVNDNNELIGLITQTDIANETHNIHKKNVRFMTYQNIQTAIIVLFFIFLIAFFIYRHFK